MSTRWDSVAVDGHAMPCFVARPGCEGPFAGVLVCMHAPGVDAFIQERVQRLAHEGFLAVAPDLYHRDPAPQDDPQARMRRLRDGTLIEDLRVGLAHLRALPEVSAERTAALGFCMGGRIAYLAATMDSALRVAVVFYGGNIMAPWGDGPSPLERSSNIACPLVGFFGAEDSNPSPQDVAHIDAELTRLGKAHQFQSYEGAGHAFLNDLRPSYRPDAAADAWEKCLSALRRHLA